MEWWEQRWQPHILHLSSTSVETIADFSRQSCCFSCCARWYSTSSQALVGVHAKKERRWVMLTQPNYFPLLSPGVIMRINFSYAHERWWYKPPTHTEWQPKCSSRPSTSMGTFVRDKRVMCDLLVHRIHWWTVVLYCGLQQERRLIDFSLVGLSRTTCEPWGRQVSS